MKSFNRRMARPVSAKSLVEPPIPWMKLVGGAEKLHHAGNFEPKLQILGEQDFNRAGVRKKFSAGF